MKTDTLSFRLFVFTSLWMLVSLAVIAILVSQDYRRTVENQFEDLITANLYNLMGSISRGDDGEFVGNPQLGDGRYQQYQSGWYWSVSSLRDTNVMRSSTSLSGLELPNPNSKEYDADFQRSYKIHDSVGNPLLMVEAKVYLGEGDDLYGFRTSGNMAVLNEEINRFSRRLILFLGIFGLGLIATSYAIMRYGLRPIRTATGQLADIRDGKADRIVGKFPQEIMPLIDETNALIKSNQSIVERSRTQVGNLAHSLKTPLSILSLETKNLPKPVGNIFTQQLSAMNSQIQSYLNRAMISARHGAITSRTDVHATLSRLIRTFNKLFPGISFEYNQLENNNEGRPGETVMIFAGEQQDLEEIVGNILENAGKSALTKVEISVRLSTQHAKNLIEIKIGDDGPGLSKPEMEFVLKRGNRLDENKPGSGLGLSIVSDILKEYGGNLRMDNSKKGGLQVIVQLPAG